MARASKNEIYQAEIEGQIKAFSNGVPWSGTFEIGIVLAQADQTFLCHYVRVTGPDGKEWTGKNRWSLKAAARSQLQQMVDAGVQLESDDLDANWQFESRYQGSDAGFLRRSSASSSATPRTA